MNATELKVTITKRRFDGSTFTEVATGTVAFVKELRRCKAIGRRFPAGYTIAKISVL